MKNISFLPLFILFGLSGFAQSTAVSTEIKGYPGEMIDLVIEKRILSQDVDMLVDPFKLKNETWCWQSEFWGKWMLSATAAYTYRPNEELMEKMQYAVDGLIATQLPDGYIGNYGPSTQLTAWDIWGRKYSMLGLIKYFEISGDKKVLKAAEKVAKHLMTQIGPEHTDISITGNYRGMASSSVLEPIVYLYSHTKNEMYLDFASYIVGQWESEKGSKLISNALENVPVSQRFAPPPKWWSGENGQKAYEMMSCYEGLLEYYKIIRKPDHLQAVINTVDDIIKSEINIAGSGSAFECWYGGKSQQTRPTYHTMETCVTMTWMKLCNNLLKLTGDPKYADEIEKTFFNALMASLKSDGAEIAKYSPLMGRRHEGEQQCKMPINCCSANGPRGFTLMPKYVAYTSNDVVTINYYGASDYKLKLANKHQLAISQKTSYPANGSVSLEISLNKPADFSLNLRIPRWSEETRVLVNGKQVDEEVSTGTYLTLKRGWKDGDVVMIELDIRGRIQELNGHQAITIGPIVLARDARFKDGFLDEPMIIPAKGGIVELTPIEHNIDGIWMAFSVRCKTGTDLEGAESEGRQVHFCDFASAGNTWSESSWYRVWIEKILNVMNMQYEKY